VVRRLLAGASPSYILETGIFPKPYQLFKEFATQMAPTLFPDLLM
jgi:hypothetical protein